MKKHGLCLGDSNTHGYCADPTDCADGGIRFNEEERWTCRLQPARGSDYLVTEEGLSGRTTVIVDPIHETQDALSAAYALLKSRLSCATKFARFQALQPAAASEAATDSETAAASPTPEPEGYAPDYALLLENFRQLQRARAANVTSGARRIDVSLE